MKTAILALFIALAFFNLSQAEVKVRKTGFLSEDAEIHETALLVSGFLKEFKVLVAQMELLSQIKPVETSSAIEVMDILSQIDISPICESCQKAVDAARNFSDKDALKDLLERLAESYCEKKLNATVCVEAVTRYGQVVWEALINRTFDAYHACERFHLCEKTTHKETLKAYVDQVLADKPALNIPTPTKKSTFTILQMTDPHIDLDYLEGTNAFCDTPLCCRATGGAAPDPTKAAGYWGTLAKCDIPMRTFDQFLQFASKNFDIDMIIWNGDNIAHNIWEQSVANQTVNTYDATQEVIKYFPDTLIYPMFGNHEAFPCDEFDFVGNDSAWLTSRLADMWGVWLDQEAVNTLRAKSYYAMNHPERNLKVIALDTVACDSNDFYLIEDPTDPMDQLAWFRTELYDSESKGQSVFIIGHINPGSYGCDSEWSARYRALIDRFTNIIRGQFYGHTHNDEIEMVRSFADNSPVGVVLIAPSLTTYSYLNPSFRLIEVDADTNVLLNYYQYRLDLDKWNKNTTGPIEWDLAYNFLEEYAAPDMSYETFDRFVDNIQTNMTLLETYLFNMDSGSHSVSNVDPRGVQDTYCSAKHSVSEDAFICLGLNATTGDLMDMAQQILPGAWKFDYC